MSAIDETWQQSDERTLTASAGLEPRMRLAPGDTLAGRYRLHELIGRGGTSLVYRAWDRLRSEDVAVKLLPAGRGSGHLRPECTALRLLDVPGVVELIDEGEAAGRPFLVMELIDGQPFPGELPDRSWEQLRPRVIDLLELVARIHRAGAVHGDLKPGNVLVRPNGAPVLLDFGLAQGPGVGSAGTGRGWTPAYAAPEQLARGLPTASADAFSIGIMIIEALTGERVHRGPGLPAPPRPPRDLDRSTRVLVEGLLLEDPAHRMGVEAALEHLGGAIAPEIVNKIDAIQAPLRPSEIEALFHGRAGFTHIAHRAARLLHRRTSGEPERLRATLTAWARDARIQLDANHDAADLLAHPESANKSCFRVSLRDLRALELGVARTSAEQPLVMALRSLVTERNPIRALPQTARWVCDRLREQGRVELATSVLDAALMHVHSRCDAEPLLVRRAAMALSTERTGPMELAIYQLDRAGVGREDVRWLLLAALAMARSEVDRAEALVTQLAPFDEEDLEIWRVATRVNVAMARGAEPHAACLQAHARWSQDGTARRRSKWQGWMGRLRYQQGRFGEACEHHLRAAAHKRPHERTSSLANAAGAAIELGPDGLDRAARILTEALAAARSTSNATEEARLHRLSRSVAYRRDLAGAARPDLVAAAWAIDRREGAFFAIHEAAIAWRGGSSDQAISLARPAAAALASMGLELPADLAAAITHLAGEAVDSTERAAMIGRLGQRGRPADVDLQILAMIGGSPALAPSLLARLAHIDRSRRLDVLSIDEALERLRSQPAAQPGVRRPESA